MARKNIALYSTAIYNDFSDLTYSVQMSLSFQFIKVSHKSCIRNVSQIW